MIRRLIQKDSERGAMMIMVLMVYTTLLTFSVTLFVMVDYEATNITIETERVQALYLAEAGISEAMYELKYLADKDGDGVGEVSERKLGPGTFRVLHDAKRLTVISIGEVNGVKRELQMQYGSF